MILLFFSRWLTRLGWPVSHRFKSFQLIFSIIPGKIFFLIITIIDFFLFCHVVIAVAPPSKQSAESFSTTHFHLGTFLESQGNAEFIVERVHEAEQVLLNSETVEY